MVGANMGMSARCRMCGRVAMRPYKNTEGVRQGYGDVDWAYGLAASASDIARGDRVSISSIVITMR